MSAIIPRGTARINGKQPRHLTVFGVDLKDAREEIFVRMVCDGLAMGVAYARAGFKSKAHDAPSKLFHLPRVQARAAKILEARRTTGVVTLSEVTDMLQRVFAGAHSEGEYSAAHNAAFSLARLYGHVTDKATLEVIRRPSRDPDAPSEQVLSDWVASLPVVGASRPEPSGALASIGPQSHAPAAPLGPGPSPSSPETSAEICAPLCARVAEGSGPQLDLFNDINSLDGNGPDGTGNGAPARPVTGAPNKRAHSEALGQEGTPIPENGSPLADEGTTYPSAEELF